MISIQEVRAADQPWSPTKIRTLIEGEAVVTITDATGREYEERREGPTAYELRCRVLDKGDVDTLLDLIQLDTAIDSIDDDVVRHAMIAVTVHGLPIDAARDWSGRGRPGHQLINRGIELVRRHERARRSDRVRVGREGGDPVCYRCTVRRVAKIGMLCSPTCDGLSRADRARFANLQPGPEPDARRYDPTRRPRATRMSRAQVEAEIEYLSRTQSDGDLPEREVDEHTDTYGPKLASVIDGTPYERDE